MLCVSSDDRSDNRRPPAELPATWTGRLLLGAVAVVGTVAYAMSFRTFPTEALPTGNNPAGAWLAPAGAAVGIAAGLSWLFFGAVLLGITGGRPSVLAWADACLRTMAAGIGVLVAAASFNVCVAALWPLPEGFVLCVNLVLLVNANALMGAVFYRQARRLGLGPVAAVTAWMAALNGAFALLLMSLYRTGAFQS